MIETNTINPLFNYNGIYGGCIKIVGVSFKNAATALPRHVTIRGFFELNTSRSTYSGDFRKLAEDVDVRVIEELESVQEDINRLVTINRELDNSYDFNAIAVYVNSHFQFTKVGYFPKELSEIIVTQKFKCYIVGFEKAGRGMMLTIIFISPYVSSIALDSEIMKSKENEKIGIMSLNKLRKKLCIQ